MPTTKRERMKYLIYVHGADLWSLMLFRKHISIPIILNYYFSSVVDMRVTCFLESCGH
jgi:hypothetical protein